MSYHANVGQGGHYGRGDHLESAEENISQFWEREDDDGRCDIDLRIAFLLTVLYIPFNKLSVAKKILYIRFSIFNLCDAFWNKEG